MTKFLIRLDDATPYMERDKWKALLDALDSYDIKPIIAVIPNNKDPKLQVASVDPSFWKSVRLWQDKGYIVAMHGYSHEYVSRQRGLVPMNPYSEFAGVPEEIQRQKIRGAWQIFQRNGITPRAWVAPAHTFDETTLNVLGQETDIRIISDGIAYYPYVEKGFLWIPQQLWWFPEALQEGIWTICLHPNTMSMQQIEAFLKELKTYHHLCQITLDEIEQKFGVRKRTVRERIWHHTFFAKRFIQQLHTQ